MPIKLVIDSHLPVDGVLYHRLFQPLMYLAKFAPDKIQVTTATEDTLIDTLKYADIYFNCSPRTNYPRKKLYFIKEHSDEINPNLVLINDYDDAPFSLIPPEHPHYVISGTEE